MIIHKVAETMTDELAEKTDKVKETGLDEKEAGEMAFMFLKPKYETKMIKHYTDFLLLNNNLSKSKLHRTLMKKLAGTVDEAKIKKIINRHTGELKGEFVYDLTDVSDEESDSEMNSS